MNLNRITPEEAKEWIMNFHKFRINQMYTDAQAKQIWNKLCKHIMSRGLRFELIGFYEYEFHEIDFKGE